MDVWTDGWTDRITTASTRLALHAVAHKNEMQLCTLATVAPATAAAGWIVALVAVDLVAVTAGV